MRTQGSVFRRVSHRTWQDLSKGTRANTAVAVFMVGIAQKDVNIIQGHPQYCSARQL